jgi:N-acetylmuramoyl-L-alanine amidase
MRTITEIVVHCTDSPDSLDVGAKEIDEWHRDKGWNEIGYNWVVRRDGTLESGRSEEKVGAHCLGFNQTSIGIVWVGRDTPTAEQYETLIEKVSELQHRFDVRTPRVFGHRELNSGRTCPNLDCAKLRDDLEKHHG